MELIPVDLGIKTIKVPLAQINGKKSGKKLLITAGADGDEYAGIEAAKRIIEEFSAKQFSGQLTVIPILNISGFEAGTSRNPIDDKFPKHIFPGKKDGTSSERLIWWLSNKYLAGADLWLDLHGGASDEILDPYVYFYETNNKILKELIIKIMGVINAPKIVFQKPGSWKKADLLAKKGIVYIITEAGSLGRKDRAMIEKHVEWAKTIMGVLGMVESYKEVKKSVKPRIYREIRTYTAKRSGIFHPLISANFIHRGQVIGTIKTSSGKLLQEIKAQEDGEFLWMKKRLFCPPNSTLLELGTEMLSIKDN